MILNNIEVNILSEMNLLDAYENKFPEGFLMENVIYCIHNEINGKNYIGQTVKIKNRFSKTYVGHFRDYDRFVSGELSETRALYRAWKKYGLKSFTVYVIDLGSDREELNEKEIYWIKTLHTCVKDPDCFGYNLTWGADDMSVNCRESIEKSLETRRKIYGEAFANCHTPEALAKGNRTKEERYGHGGFINAFTPEANEKRRQTNLEKYGTLHGPRISKEALKRMVDGKIEKYGDPMGTCNTPENREKARRNLAITNIFKSINNNISKTDKLIENFNQYYEFISSTYKSISSVNHHVKQVLKYLPDLRKDERWVDNLEKIFNDLINMSEESLDKIIQDKLKERRKIGAEKQRGVHKDSTSATITVLFKTIENNISKSNGVLNWEQYCNSIFTNYVSKHKAYKHLNKIIEFLPKLKLDKRWIPEYENLFGELTEENKVYSKRKRSK